MTQCGLCLSCGAPFLPSAEQMGALYRTANQSILFLNKECETNPELLSQFQNPEYAAVREGAHVFHRSHHGPAVEYMTKHHTFAGTPAWVGGRLPWLDGPFAFHQTPQGATPGPRAAVWDPPAVRLDYGPLLAHITTSAVDPSRNTRNTEMGNIQDEIYYACKACNAIMTQRGNMAFLLGYGPAGALNPHGCIITGQPIRVRVAAQHNQPLRNAYGAATGWSVPAGPTAPHPTMNGGDCASPHVAYYLHMCLPTLPVGGITPFNQPGAGRAARRLYIELSWIVLEIASLATLLEEGQRYAPGGKLTHGIQQHYGALDFYVSYFLWRLCYFDHKAALDRNGIDFVQWHQKYFWDAINCPALFPRGTAVIGTLVYTNVDVNARTLVVDIVAGLMDLYTNQMAPLIRFVSGDIAGPPALPIEVSAFFLPPAALRVLKRRSRNQVVAGDFESALQTFGASALLFRSIQLCPRELKVLLKDFREQWQWREIESVRRHTQGLVMRSAYALYIMCSLLDPPAVLPVADKARAEAILFDGEYCSPWTAVLSLDTIGAFGD